MKRPTHCLIFHSVLRSSFIPLVLLGTLSGSSTWGQSNTPRSIAVGLRLVKEALKVPFKVTHFGLGRVPTEGLPGGQGDLCLLLEPRDKKLTNSPFGTYYGDVKTRIILRLSELRGQVKITSPEEALAYVRLPTTPSTCFIVGRRKEEYYAEIEVMDRNQDIPALSYGVRWESPGPPLERWHSFPEGRYGLISATTAKQLGITFASVFPVGSGFAVERTLLVRHHRFGHYYLVKTREWVGYDGEYRIDKNETLHLPTSPAVAWEFPVFASM